MMNNLRHGLNTFWKRASYWPLSEPSGLSGSPAEQTAPLYLHSQMCI